MKIEFSFKNNPTAHSTVDNVTSYIQTANECLLFDEHGLLIVLLEKDIEDFSVFGLAGEES